jgi:predicted transposase/invertase (TIGR01784 family)
MGVWVTHHKSHIFYQYPPNKRVLASFSEKLSVCSTTHLAHSTEFAFMTSRSNPNRTLISFDWAVKHLLKRKSTRPILEGFLSVLFGRDIRIDTLLESESVPEAENDKTNRVDLLCQTSLDEHIIIEIQFYRQIDYFQRMLYATSRLVVANMEQGMRYERVKKVYSVNLVYFDLGEGSEYLYRGATYFRGSRALKLNEAQQKKFRKKYPHELFPEYYIIKISNFDDIPKNALDEWIYYFKHTALPDGYSAKGLDEVEKQLKFDDMEPRLKSQYLKILRDLNADENPMLSTWLDGEATGEHKGYLAGLEKGRKRGRAEGIREGMEKGKLKGLEEGIERGGKLQMETTVVNLFKRGVAISDIAAIHQIEAEEVERILAKNGVS